MTPDTNLTFSSFKWDKNIIEVAQQKTGEPVTLPLLNDVGEAVIDYIRYARPKSDLPFLFLKLNAPNDVMYANSIHHTVYTRLKEAGIRLPMFMLGDIGGQFLCAERIRRMPDNRHLSPDRGCRRIR